MFVNAFAVAWISEAGIRALLISKWSSELFEFCSGDSIFSSSVLLLPDGTFVHLFNVVLVARLDIFHLQSCCCLTGLLFFFLCCLYTTNPFFLVSMCWMLPVHSAFLDVMDATSPVFFYLDGDSRDFLFICQCCFDGDRRRFFILYHIAAYVIQPSPCMW